MIAGNQTNSNHKRISYSFHNSIKLDRLVKKTAIDELWGWVNSEVFSICPICNVPFKYPGLDAAFCLEHGWVESRQTKLEALCRTPVKLGAAKKKPIKPSELSESMARIALLTLKKEAA